MTPRNQPHFNSTVVGKSLIFSSDELCPYTSDDIHGAKYQFLQCIKKDNKQTLDPNDSNVLCNTHLNVLVPKLTLKSAKELANLTGHVHAFKNSA